MFIPRLWRKIKQYKNKITEFENVVDGERLSFSQVMEKNAALQLEISQRMEELQQANKSILTLQNIWSTMNSAEPLNEVLKTIAQGMTQNLDYLNAIIFQVFGEEEEAYLKIRENSCADSLKILKPSLDKRFEDVLIPISSNDNIVVQTIINNKITKVNNYKDIFQGTNLQFDDEQIKHLEKLFLGHAMALIPIIFQNKNFGCLLVISPRKELNDMELNFLSLFAKQIELAVTIADLFQTVREQAITDGLTTLYNRRYFDQCLEREAKRSLRLKQPFTLVSFDLDHLKTINDNFGHSAGDAAIITMANVLRENARGIDIPARFGGEEFGIILPGIDIQGGKIAAERMRAAIENSHVECVGQITASVGVGTFLTHTNNIQELVELVDQAMYRAKRSGRNRVEVVQPWDENIWKRQALDFLIHLLEQKAVPISDDLAKELIEKLKATNTNDKNIDDIIFFVIDEFVKIYEPYYQRGNIKEKIELIVKIAKRMNIAQEDIDKFKVAAMVYDISNIMLPESILLKNGPLDDMEKTQILNHPIAAAKEILAPVGTASNIISLLENWNEHFDGSGNPGILFGDDIPIGTAILVAVDAYFALISERPYRKAFAREIAINILSDGSGKKWNPQVISVLLELIEK